MSSFESDIEVININVYSSPWKQQPMVSTIDIYSQPTNSPNSIVTKETTNDNTIIVYTYNSNVYNDSFVLTNNGVLTKYNVTIINNDNNSSRISNDNNSSRINNYHVSKRGSPGPIQRCNSRFANCNITKGPYPSGTINNTSNTLAQRVSTLIRVQPFMRNATWTNRYIPVNSYGQRSGGPNGSGQPPRNSF
jgi:hypothetical protein